MKRIEIRLSDSEYSILKRQAAAKGLGLSGFVKSTVFTYIAQHPAQGVFTELYDIERGDRQKTSENPASYDESGDIRGSEV